MKKGNVITLIIVLAVIILAIIIINKPNSSVDPNTAKCIGNNSVIYVQLGCSACKLQEDMFGDSYQYLTRVDCFYERDKCSNITATPTWTIKGQTYVGVQSIKILQNLTGC